MTGLRSATLDRPCVYLSFLRNDNNLMSVDDSCVVAFRGLIMSTVFIDTGVALDFDKFWTHQVAESNVCFALGSKVV